MKIVFFGTPDFAVSSLNALMQSSHQVLAVVTAPDKPSGRGLQTTSSAVKQYALEKKLEVLQPEKLKDEAFHDRLKALGADLFIVVAFRMLPELVWNLPKHGTYNLHASLLPKYRGAAPINWALINGDSETGITTFKLQHAIDTGDVLLQEAVPLDQTITAGELYEILKIKGAVLLTRTVDMIEAYANKEIALPFIKQSTAATSHAPKLNKETGRIQWASRASAIHNLVRGLSPAPGAWTLLKQGDQQQQIKIYKTAVISDQASKGTGSITSDGKSQLVIGCGETSLAILELQAEGRKRMATEEFLRGFKILPEAYFE